MTKVYLMNFLQEDTETNEEDCGICLDPLGKKIRKIRMQT